MFGSDRSARLRDESDWSGHGLSAVYQMSVGCESIAVRIECESAEVPAASSIAATREGEQPPSPEPTAEEVAHWIEQWGLQNVVSRDLAPRAFKALQLLRFGSDVTLEQKRRVF